MNSITLDQLSEDQHRVLSFVKSHVVLSLLEVLSDRDEEAAGMITGRKFLLQIQTWGGPACYLESNGERLIFGSGRRGFPTLTLLFLSPEKLNRMLSGGRQNPIPVITGFAFSTAVGTFKKLSSRLRYFMEGEGAGLGEYRPIVTELLLSAAAFGLVQVGEQDDYVFPRVDSMPDGSVDVTVAGHPDIAAHLIKRGRSLEAHRGRLGERTTALMEFDSLDTAYAVLAGKANAMEQLGTGHVRIRGKLPLIQGVFQLLDRLGFYMAVKA